MDLSITNISFFNFRSYDKFALHTIGPLTIFVGPNAVGKTNIIEGIQLLTAQMSFKHPTMEQLIHSGAQFGRIEADVSDSTRQLHILMSIEEGKRKYLLNSKHKKAVDLKGLIPSVTFTPDDLELAKGSMSIRRNALDALGSQLSKNHYLIQHDYEKVLRHKNRLLKDEASSLLLDSIDETLVTCGAQLLCYRIALFEKLSQFMKKYYTEITDGKESLYSCYIPSWESDTTYKKTSTLITRDEARSKLSASLMEHRVNERTRHRALIGPHADRIEFFVNDREVATFGSQGQQRSVVLAFKLAEVSLIQEVLHQKPILLLDDVMSELDTARRRALISFIADDIQTFITTTTLSYFDPDILSNARIVELPLMSTSTGE